MMSFQIGMRESGMRESRVLVPHADAQSRVIPCGLRSYVHKRTMLSGQVRPAVWTRDMLDRILR